MALLGAILGLLVGAMLQSIPAAILFAVIGGLAVPKLLGVSKQSTAKLKAQESADTVPMQRWPVSVEQLQERVAELEQRVAFLEAHLADGAQPTVMEAKNASPQAQQQAVVADVSDPNEPIALAQISKVATASVATAATAEKAAPTLPNKPAVLAPPQDRQATISTPTPGPEPVRASSQRAPAPPEKSLRERLPAPIANLIFGGNMLVKLGVLILFLGLAFLLKYTAERVTVSIELRYASVSLVGLGLLVLGWMLRRKRADYAIILQGAGVGVFYLTILAAMKLHALLPVTAGFAFLFAVAVLSAALAVLQNAPSLAIIAALEGFAAPVLASTGENHPIGLFTYLLVLDMGIFLMAWFKAWRLLNLIGAVGTFMLAGSWAQRYYTDDQYGIVQTYAIVFFLLFTAVGVLFARRTLFDVPPDDKGSLAERAADSLRRVGRVDSSLVFGIPMAAFGLQYLLMRPYEYGAAFSSMAFSAFYLLLGRWVYATQPRGLALLAEAYAIIGVIFATLAIPLGLEGQWTGAAWAIEAAGMYWLGVRQNRPYARAFAFVVFAGAIFKLLQATALDGLLGHPLLQGSVIGPSLVAVGAFAMWTFHRRAKLDLGKDWESLAGVALPWLGMAVLTQLLWQEFVPAWAAVATALLATVVFALALIFALQPLSYVAYGMQALAVAGFITTLHRGNTDQALASGWQGAVQAGLIALSILGSVGWSMARMRRAALAAKVQPEWSLGNILAVLAGVGLLHLAMLFQISLHQAALLWPLSATVVLWVALRMAHHALALQAVLLHGVSALLYLFYRSTGLDAPSVAEPFASLSFWIPVVLGLSALLCGDWIRGESKRGVYRGAVGHWVNSWCAASHALWTPVVWGLAWWLWAMMDESSWVLSQHQLAELTTAVWVTILLVTSIVAVVVARWREWEQLGRATLATLPALILIALNAAAISVGDTQPYIPSSGLGWIAWPVALVWHWRLLRAQQKWLDASSLAPLHIVGYWFFVLLAARECQWQLGRIADAWSTWQMLGWAMVPALSLWALCSRRLLQRWPLNEFRHAYLEVAAVPVAIYLLLWAWVSNAASSGDAAPLPYVPLLNPLELAHGLVLIAVLLWWRALSDKTTSAVPPSVAKMLLGVTGLALLTGLVLRCCHHFAGVLWNFEALYASRLTQAALSIAWATCGVVAMVLGHGKRLRLLWVAGASLLGVVVLKLFFVELADRGGLFRIISFLGVGGLLLLVGYFAPVPPSKEEALKAKGGAA
jgi:uncharacterized membrane protein